VLLAVAIILIVILFVAAIVLIVLLIRWRKIRLLKKNGADFIAKVIFFCFASFCSI
jgi:hypothetical protein